LNAVEDSDSIFVTSKNLFCKIRLWDQAEKEDLTYVMSAGLREEEFEKKVVADNDVIFWSTDTAKASFDVLQRRHGWQPFRLGTKVIIMKSLKHRKVENGRSSFPCTPGGPFKKAILGEKISIW